MEQNAHVVPPQHPSLDNDTPKLSLQTRTDLDNALRHLSGQTQALLRIGPRLLATPLPFADREPLGAEGVHPAGSVPVRAKVNAPYRPVQSSPLGSLIYRPTLSKKRTVQFLALRHWNAKTKTADLAALREAKTRGSGRLAREVGREIAGVLGLLLGRTSECVITTPPQGATVKHKHYFAGKIADVVADLLGATRTEAFVPRPRAGTSYPQAYRRRGDLFLWKDRARGPLMILVDDVATSGKTLEECAAALRDESAVLPVVWIYEEEQ